MSDTMTKISELKDCKMYLAGPIDKVSDDGIEWREEFKQRMKDNDIDINVFDPCAKPGDMGSEVGTEKTKVRDLLAEGKWEEAQKFCKRFRRMDLRAVDASEVVIARIDLSCHMCGSYDEMFTAYRQGKPVFILMADGQKKEDVSNWILTYIKGPEDIFESMNELIGFLDDIDLGNIEKDSRWLKIY